MPKHTFRRCLATAAVTAVVVLLLSQGALVLEWLSSSRGLSRLSLLLLVGGLLVAVYRRRPEDEEDFTFR